jgi:type II secretory pathway pseudopilin PulG
MHKGLVLVLVLFLSSCGQSSPQTPAAKPADERAAIAALNDINQAQKDYFRRYRRYALAYDELVAEHLLKEEPTASGFDLQMKPSADASRYAISANPTGPSGSARHLFTDQTGVVRAELGKDATAESPAI